MEPSREQDHDRALALAGVALVKAVIDVLEQQSILKEAEIHAVFERALTSLEFRHQDGATGLARRIVEGIAVSRDTQAPKDTST